MEDGGVQGQRVDKMGNIDVEKGADYVQIMYRLCTKTGSEGFKICQTFFFAKFLQVQLLPLL